MIRVSRNGPEARLARYHPVRFYLLRDDAIWDQIVESRAAAIEKDRDLSLSGVGEQLYFRHIEGSNLLSGLEQYTFPRERLDKAFSEEHGSANNTLETTVQGWHGSGQQIFDLSAISAMFLESDAMKTPAGRLRKVCKTPC
jgi:hypothetical protein